jgi:hypothetical protein
MVEPCRQKLCIGRRFKVKIQFVVLSMEAAMLLGLSAIFFLLIPS